MTALRLHMRQCAVDASASNWPDTRDASALVPPDSILELGLAVERHEASFSQVCKALWLGRDGWARPEIGAMAVKLYPSLLRAFVHAHGPIEESFYCQDLPAGVVLTRTPGDNPERLVCELHSVIWWEQVTFDTHESRRLHSELMQLRDRVMGFIPPDDDRRDLAPQERHRLLHEIYCIACDLFATLNREWKECGSNALRPSDRHCSELADLAARVVTAKANYQAASRRIGQRWFLPGVWVGIAPATVPLVALGTVALWLGVDPAWVATAGAGMVGSVLSVLQRMTSGSLAICAEADRKLVWRVGLFRPLIGVIIGVASYVLLHGGLIPLHPPNGGSQPLFFAGVAFIAGFSERFARDMMAAPTQLLAPSRREGRTTPVAPTQTTVAQG